MEDKVEEYISSDGDKLDSKSSISNKENDHFEDRVPLKNKIFSSLKGVMAGNSKDNVSITEDLKELR